MLNVVELNDLLATLPWQERLPALLAQHAQGVVFSTSFGLEDQVLTHHIASQELSIEVFTLDTGRLFEETYKTYADTTAAYPMLTIKPYFPDANAVEVMVDDQGINGFYQSVAARKRCCFVRKVEPLNRALAGAKIWISGLRQAQSSNRQGRPFAEVDAERGLIKVYPLLDVGTTALWKYAAQHQVPVNPLHQQGFPSIGCAPCTRAVQLGENPRAGRWWWEQDTNQECGLHVATDGTLVRANVQEDAHV